MKLKNCHIHGFKRDQRLIRKLIALALTVCFQSLMLSPNPVVAGTSHSAAPTNTETRKTAKEIEYEVKAAFIYNFMKFVEWPPGKSITDKTNPQESAPMTIGILGDNPFGKAFEPVLTKKVGHRPIRIIEIESFHRFQKRYQSLSEAIEAYLVKYDKTLGQCEVVFISDSEKTYFNQLLKLLCRRAILTVSDLPGFAEKGGMIGFVIDQKKVRFEINQDSAKRENLKIRSQLLRLARRIYKNQDQT